MVTCSTIVFLKAQYTVYLHEHTHTHKKRERLEEGRKETDRKTEQQRLNYNVVDLKELKKCIFTLKTDGPLSYDSFS